MQAQANVLLMHVSAKASVKQLASLKEKGCMDIMSISNLQMQQLCGVLESLTLTMKSTNWANKETSRLSSYSFALCYFMV